MKYVIEKNGSAVSQVSAWTPAFAKKCKLSGNASAPALPHTVKGIGILRAVRVERVAVTGFQMANDNPGVVVGDEWLITQSVQDRPLEQVKVTLVNKVKLVRDRIVSGGVIWSPDGGNTTYEVQSDKDSRFEMAGAVQILEHTGATEQGWRMLDNSMVVLSLSQLKDMGVAIRNHVNACFVRQAELEAIIAGAATVDDLHAIDLEAGWPTELADQAEAL
ncbi:DUF4376 domain-containing protein [Kiloniella sp. EL199]|uniref:DUF4376 domain-containing protein n=1 Tax=Kiloniella sp. EL199 TaxID=2107581 RepID=UPI000EA19082|nr:DUF4376 domain-containing protein [Kiloniella sp. EL199]